MTSTSPHRQSALGTWVLVCLLAGPLTAWAQQKDAPRAKYLAALEKLKGANKGQVEPVFHLGLAAAKKLQQQISERDMAPASDPKSKMPVDTKLEGFSVSTEEVLYAVPEPAYFLELARKKGTPVDIAFFENLQRTFAHHPAWPVFIEQQTDYSGCTLYHSPDLIAVYRGWSEFAAKYPKAYKEEVAKELQRIHTAMTGDGCACEKPEGVTAGFEAFLQAFPKAPIADKVKARLEALRAGKGDFRFECHSG
jgi:hypothetical protein